MGIFQLKLMVGGQTHFEFHCKAQPKTQTNYKGRNGYTDNVFNNPDKVVESPPPTPPEKLSVQLQH